MGNFTDKIARCFYLMGGFTDKITPYKTVLYMYHSIVTMFLRNGVEYLNRKGK